MKTFIGRTTILLLILLFLFACNKKETPSNLIPLKGEATEKGETDAKDINNNQVPLDSLVSRDWIEIAPVSGWEYISEEMGTSWLREKSSGYKIVLRNADSTEEAPQEIVISLSDTPAEERFTSLCSMYNTAKKIDNTIANGIEYLTLERESSGLGLDYHLVVSRETYNKDEKGCIVIVIYYMELSKALPLLENIVIK